MTDDQPLLPEHAAEKPTDSASECPKTNADKPIFIITGLSGAGKSTVLHVFEDMRLFTADGVPPELMPEMVRLLQSSSVEPSHGIALGFDQRRSEFMAELDQALHGIPHKDPLSGGGSGRHHAALCHNPPSPSA